MKIKLLLLSLVILVMGESMSAQLVLQICKAQLPCPGFPLGSVQAGVDQNGWRNFKVTLTQNVSLFSIVGVPPPSQASVNVIFTQDATGGRTVTFASNITNPCTIATGANATTLCQFEFDGIAGIWFGISGGGLTSLPSVALGSVLASQGLSSPPNFQTKTTFDVRDSLLAFDCTGTTAMDTAMQTISSSVHIIVPTGCIVRFSSAHSYPQTIEFKQGSQFKPDTGVLVTLTGPIIAGSYQIFNNALATQGGIDFTGNVNTFNVLPEWWGAGTNASAATNTTALQAAIYGAFGCNVSPVTVCRTNGAGTSYYNKRLYLAGEYTISGELHWYHTLNFIVEGAGRLLSGIIQGAANSRIIDGQSNAYGVFRDLSFSAVNNTQDLNHPLVDLNFDGSQGVDLKPQFIDFYNVNWNGNGLAKIGVRIAGAGGGAQGSNINFYNNLGESFTEAAYMIGSGSGCVPTNVATNAIQISWYGGDMQGNHAYGVEDFGGGNLLWLGGTAENGGNIAVGNIQQTGADFCANNINGGNGGFTIKHTRSESPYLLAPAGGAGNSGGWNLIDVVSADDISRQGQGGGTSLNDLYEGESSCGHGLWYKVTTAGTLGGLGSRIAPLTASAGSATTITDSVGGFTVNAWIGSYVCTLSGAGFPEYCLITSNTASVFTCSAGWVTDYPSIPVVNPANGTTYDIQPAWGPATVTSGTTTLTRDDTTYSGISLAIDTFFPGKIVAVVPAAVIDNMQLTRADWAQIASFPESPVEATELSVLVGSPSITAAGSAGITFNPYFVRTWTLSRNGLSEIPFMVRKDYGTRVLHWYAGQNAGGSSTTDAYVGIDPIVPSLSTPAGQGDLFILNNSSNVQKKWTFNFDGSATFPGVLTAIGGTPTVSGTGACVTTSTQVGGLWAGLVTCTGATGASTLVITPGITAAHGFRCPADDETTNANKLTQSTQSPTTCTIAGTVNANDVIAFGPIVAF